MPQSFVADFWDGKYSGYSSGMFASDLAFSIINHVGEKKNVRIYLNPTIFDSEIKTSLEVVLSRNFPFIEIFSDESVSLDQIWKAELLEELDNEHERFNEFLVEQNHNSVCSEEDFRLLKLFILYRKFNDQQLATR